MKEVRRKIIKTLFFPFIFVFIIWGVKIYEVFLKTSFIHYGIYPQEINGLKGVIFAPFIHKDLQHLLNNSLPILILGSMICFFYKKIFPKIFFWLFFITGLWTWSIGRPCFHIGASGFIYSLASFIFLSGIIRKNPRLSAASLIVIFLYGSLFWGMFPVEITISWEGHLSGFLAGIFVAIYYRKEGPSQKKYSWEIEEELNSNEL